MLLLGTNGERKHCKELRGRTVSITEKRRLGRTMEFIYISIFCLLSACLSVCLSDCLSAYLSSYRFRRFLSLLKGIELAKRPTPNRGPNSLPPGFLHSSICPPFLHHFGQQVHSRSPPQSTLLTFNVFSQPCFQLPFLPHEQNYLHFMKPSVAIHLCNYFNWTLTLYWYFVRAFSAYCLLIMVSFYRPKLSLLVIPRHGSTTASLLQRRRTTRNRGKGDSNREKEISGSRNAKLEKRLMTEEKWENYENRERERDDLQRSLSSEYDRMKIYKL